jgi:Zn ribbon nucleic-acid-binding protein
LSNIPKISCKKANCPENQREDESKMSPDPKEVKIEYTEEGLVTGYYCPHCSEKVELDHVDDIKTKWFKCLKCGEYCTKPKTEEQKRLEESIKKLEDIHRPTTLEEIAEVLSTTIKKDEKNKVITFLIMILTYTDSDQTNIGFNSESSTGKSYIPLELSWYFPHDSGEDVIKYGYVSPTAFFHEAGVLLPDPTEPEPEPSIDPEEQKEAEKKRRKIIWINLEKKILIFLDQPHDQLLQRLRPLLSHDEKVIVHEITDRSRKGSLITKKVWIQGYFTVIFCTAKFSMDEQERTRLILLSPETSQEKIKEGILLKIEKDSDKDAFQKYMESNPQRQWLKNRVLDIKQEGIKNIIIPEELKQKITKKFLETHDNLVPRHQRDIGRLMALIKAHCLLNLWSRERKDDNIVTTEMDIDEGFRIYEDIAKSNELGLPPEVYNIFMELEPNIPENGITRKDFLKLYFSTFHRTLGSKRLKEILDLLETVGLLSEEPDPNDRKQKIILKLVAGQRVCIRENLTGTKEPQKSLITTEATHIPQGVSKNFSSDQAKSILELNPSLTGLCSYCGKGSLDMVNYPKIILRYSVETFSGKKYLVCEDCGLEIMKAKKESDKE